MANFSIFDAIGNRNDSDSNSQTRVTDSIFNEWIDHKNKKLQVQQPSKPSSRELTATAAHTQTQTKYYFSIYDSIGLE